MHNDHLTISTFQLFQMFPDAESARVYLELRRWPQGPRCCSITGRSVHALCLPHRAVQRPLDLGERAIEPARLVAEHDPAR